jgi:hypothetical protein
MLDYLFVAIELLNLDLD